MIGVGARLKVVDNSGATMVRCIKVCKGKKFATVGDVIVAVVMKSIPSSNKVNTSDIVKCVVVSSAAVYQRKDYSSVRSDLTAVVLLDKQMSILGTRVLAPVQRELKALYPRIVSLAPEVF